MRQDRLVIFCTDLDVDLDALRGEAAPLLERLSLSHATLKPVAAPEELHDAGWLTLAVRAPRAGGVAALAAHLGELTHAAARALQHEAIGLYLDNTGAKARACLHGPGGFPRLLEGDPFHVIRQVAAWLETDPAPLTRHFSAAPKGSALQGPLDLSVVAPPDEASAEVDEDDRFVEGKLQQARELMDRYLGRRK